MTFVNEKSIARAVALIRVERALLLALLDSIAWLAQMGSGVQAERRVTQSAFDAIREAAIAPADSVAALASALLTHSSPDVKCHGSELRRISAKALPSDAPPHVASLETSVAFAVVRLSKIAPPSAGPEECRV